MSSDWVQEQQQSIKRDSLCKHYVGHRPHPLPSAVFFFSLLYQQPLLPHQILTCTFTCSRGRDTSGPEPGERWLGLAEPHQACVAPVHRANKHSTSSCQQTASANAIAPGPGLQQTTLQIKGVIPLHLSPSCHGEDSASQGQPIRAVPTKLPPLVFMGFFFNWPNHFGSFCSAENIHLYQSTLQSLSFPAFLALGWGVAQCVGWLSHDHRGQSGALASVRQGPASKQGLGSTLLIY